ncbi:MAG: four helix bundle protein [Candidatus Aureabacteria bacterium]|nr:four helix bundle protein [Candidatus Auribacterota bacterium]
MPVRRFEDLVVWQLARKYRHEIYKISAKFPRKEEYHLTAQIRSAAVSITANIAEGYGRYSYQENIQFCRIARGSINETLDHLCTARDEEYISESEYPKLYDQGREVEKTLNGYIGFLQREKNNRSGN